MSAIRTSLTLFKKKKANSLLQNKNKHGQINMFLQSYRINFTPFYHTQKQEEESFCFDFHLDSDLKSNLNFFCSSPSTIDVPFKNDNRNFCCILLSIPYETSGFLLITVSCCFSSRTSSYKVIVFITILFLSC